MPIAAARRWYWRAERLPIRDRRSCLYLGFLSPFAWICIFQQFLLLTQVLKGLIERFAGRAYGVRQLLQRLQSFRIVEDFFDFRGRSLQLFSKLLGYGRVFERGTEAIDGLQLGGGKRVRQRLARTRLVGLLVLGPCSFCRVYTECKKTKQNCSGNHWTGDLIIWLPVAVALSSRLCHRLTTQQCISWLRRMDNKNVPCRDVAVVDVEKPGLDVPEVAKESAAKNITLVVPTMIDFNEKQKHWPDSALIRLDRVLTVAVVFGIGALCWQTWGGWVWSSIVGGLLVLIITALFRRAWLCSKQTSRAVGTAAQATLPTHAADSDELKMRYAWDWFQFHADQRLKAFNYFLVIVVLLATALGTMMKEAHASA